MAATTTHARAAIAPARSADTGEVYARLTSAISRGEKERARRIYFDEIVPDKRFSHNEVARLAYRLGAIDEGDCWLANQPDE